VNMFRYAGEQGEDDRADADGSPAAGSCWLPWGVRIWCSVWIEHGRAPKNGRQSQEVSTLLMCSGMGKHDRGWGRFLASAICWNE